MKVPAIAVPMIGAMVMTSTRAGAMTALILIVTTNLAASQTDDAGRGERLFRTCAPCHSLQPDRNMTGPSLAGLWHRKAGGLASFSRYSPALKASNIIWDDATLDHWLADPQRFIPGNTMPFAGIGDAGQRRDLIAFLKDASQSGHTGEASQGGGMGGMMGGATPNLRKLDAAMRVSRITHCHDTYHVTTADGTTRDFWERNLRFKTDTSGDGPEKGAPALVPAGMMGDRGDVIFADPGEISAAIAPQC